MGEQKNTKEKGSKREKDFVKNIIDNYCELEKSIVYQLKLYNEYHSTTTGSLREDIWMQLFERIIPKKFVIEHSVFVIDSNQRISKEVDLAIIDNTYTPYIFQYGRLKYVPIEAVAAVIECKSTRVKFVEFDKNGNEIEAGLSVWCDSIKELRTSRKSIVRMANGTVVEGKSYGSDINKNKFSSTQTSTRPIRIFCGYETSLTKENEEEIKNLFDFVILASAVQGQEKITITVREDMDSLWKWYRELDHYSLDGKTKIEVENKDVINIMENEKLEGYKLRDLEVKRNGEKISLLTFNLQLNQLLMLINNPILFPHLAYANLFDDTKKE
ncbi:hypothetical protein GPL15_16675 [Clostridium sp. MCC353]|uniref:DUF6602 domain-containing protein n=1 Tax=Clostridium sp. MCC353 TaxID=2592646 RepID=UPI001C010702|nr:DUF6602 domain-containing protein [Clostridium sp. MCC353]MBT9778136.1 hypothetical protein [Clostridium sp. MCC353]